MGSSSVSTHRGLVYWQELLLVVSLLNFWSQPTTAQVIVESTDALEGTDVTLHVYHNVHDADYFLWYKGENTDTSNNIAYLAVNDGIYVRGPRSGQYVVNNHGSLLLKKVTMKDSGIYTIQVLLGGCQQIISCGWLDVYPRVRVPTLQANNTTVRENKDAVVFTCHTDADVIEWFFNSTILRYTQRMKLSFDRRSLTIDPVVRWDAGDYQCKGSNPKSSNKSASVKLDVKFE